MRVCFPSKLKLNPGTWSLRSERLLARVMSYSRDLEDFKPGFRIRREDR